MVDAAPELSRWVAQLQRIVTAKSVQISSELAMFGQTARKYVALRDDANDPERRHQGR